MVNRRRLIIGAYGVGNLGDEAILAGILNLFKTNLHSGNDQMIVFSGNPKETERTHKIKAKRRNIPDLVKSDEIILGGGELFQRISNMAIKFSLVGLFSKLLRKKVIFYAIGVSSNLDYLEKMLTRFCLNVADEIAVRDQPSKNRLLELGVYKPIKVVVDPSVRVEPISSKQAVFLLEKEGIKLGDSTIRIAITSQHFQNKQLTFQIYGFFYKFLKNLLLDTDVQVIFIPFTKHSEKPFDRDILYGKSLASQLKSDNFKVIEGHYSPQQMMGIIGLMDVVLSTRFHPLVFGKKMNVFAIGIGVFDKTISFCKDNDLALVRVDELAKIPLIISDLVNSK
jgi:polysaccharide pyruvyl transferase WcaK-like protein